MGLAIIDSNYTNVLSYVINICLLLCEACFPLNISNCLVWVFVCDLLTFCSHRQILRQAEARDSVGGKANVLLPVESDDPTLVGTSWRRKRRKRRQLRAEKILYDPRATDCDGGDDSGTVKKRLVGLRVSGDSHDCEVPGDESSSGDEGGSGLEQASDSGNELDQTSALEHETEGDGTKHASEKSLMEGGGGEVSSHLGQTGMDEKTPAIIDVDATAECTSVARQPVVYVQLQRDPEIQVSENALVLCDSQYYLPHQVVVQVWLPLAAS